MQTLSSGILPIERVVLMQERNAIISIDDYIAACPENIRPKLTELREIISRAEPEMTERISWRMPTFFLGGNVIHFAAHDKHIGLYPGPKVIEVFSHRLGRYKTSKGAIRIPNDMPLDRDLIRDIVRFNIETRA
ncbi:MAG: DUF1801 domain-containing protein [Oscillospiraceae bacterium]|nr:DUF1801 domain-containing protein [Oscillospiraceae bacterium]